MAPRTVRRLVIAVCVSGIAGMVVTSIADSTGGALTFGLVTASAALGLILVTAVTAAPEAVAHDQEALAEQVERRIRQVVDQGAEEDAVRGLVSDAAALGASSRRAGGSATA